MFFIFVSHFGVSIQAVICQADMTFIQSALLKQQGQVEYTPPLQHSIFVSFETCISIDCERFEFLEQNPCQNWCLSF